MARDEPFGDDVVDEKKAKWQPLWLYSSYTAKWAHFQDYCANDQ